MKLFFEPSGDGMAAAIHDERGAIICEAKYDDFESDPGIPEKAMEAMVEAIDRPDFGPQLRLEEFLTALVNVLNQNPSMGDETDIQSIEQYGLYGARVITNGGIFIIRVGLDP